MEENKAQEAEKFIDDDRIFCDECELYVGQNWFAKCEAGQTYLLGIKNRCTLFRIRKPKTNRFWE